MIIYDYIFKGAIASILIMLFYAALHFVPFSFFVDVKEVHTWDACAGTDTLTVYSERYPRWGVKGHVYAQLVQLDGEFVRETTISRSTKFGYEADTTKSTYDTRWSETIDTPSTYGINSWIEIYPLPFVTIKEFVPYTQDKFNVEVCD